MEERKTEKMNGRENKLPLPLPRRARSWPRESILFLFWGDGCEWIDEWMRAWVEQKRGMITASADGKRRRGGGEGGWRGGEGGREFEKQKRALEMFQPSISFFSPKTQDS